MATTTKPTRTKGAAPKRSSAPKRPSVPPPPEEKVSPLKGMSIEAWISLKASGWQADVIRRLISLTENAAPGAAMEIKWAQPVAVQNGPVLWIKPATEHVTLGFWRGAELPDPAGWLEGGDRMKHLKIRSLDEVDDRQLRIWIREAARLNTTKGDPTRRG